MKDLPKGAAAAALAGPGVDPTMTDSLLASVRRALYALSQKDTALAATVAGTSLLENDPRLNAGTGAALRLDGNVELEALLMDSEGHLGGVAALRNVQHPVQVAHAAVHSPHHLLVGSGAQRFAAWLGMAEYDPRTPATVKQHQALLTDFPALAEGPPGTTTWPPTDPEAGFQAWKAYVQLPDASEKTQRATAPVPSADAAAPPATSIENVAPTGSAEAQAAASPATTGAQGSTAEAPPASAEAGASQSAKETDESQIATRVDSSTPTVAMLVREGPGRFAGVVDTGGRWLALPGSVGAVVMVGAALYVGNRGAVAVVGPDAKLIEGLLARRTYDKLIAFQSARAAAQWALGQLSGHACGVMVMDARNIVAMSSAPMAWAKAEPNETSSATPATPPSTLTPPQPAPPPPPGPPVGAPPP